MNRYFISSFDFDLHEFASRPKLQFFIYFNVFELCYVPITTRLLPS